MNEVRVRVYSLKTCIPCDRMKAWLHTNGIPFTVKYLDNVTEKRRNIFREAFISRTGYHFVPMVRILIGSEKIWISNEGHEEIQYKVKKKILALMNGGGADSPSS